MIPGRPALPVLAALLALAPAALADGEPGPEGFELPRPAAGGVIAVAVEPSALLLGAGAGSRVTARLPAGATRPRVLAARGTIEDVSVGGGEVTARYRAPEARVPGLDVVAVLADAGDETLFGFFAVRLVGQGRAVIRTRPLAEAVIRIRGVRFGPVRADRNGEAAIRVMVPPGTAFGVDGEGGEVLLGVPPAGRLFAFAAEQELSAGGGATEILAVVTASDGGVAKDGDRPAATAALAEVAGPKSLGAGLYRFRCSAPAGVANVEGPGEETVTVELRLEGDPESVTRIDLALSPPEPTPEPGPEPKPEPVAPAASWIWLAPKVGWATNLGALHALDVMAEIGVGLPVTGGDLRAVLEAGFAWSGAGSEGDLEASTWVVPGTVGLAWRQPLGERFGLLAAVQGGGALLVNSLDKEGESGAEVSSRERAVVPVAGGALAGDWRLGDGAALLEVRYLWVGGALESLRGRLSTLFVNLGYRFDL